METDGFTLVKASRKRKKKPTAGKVNFQQLCSAEGPINLGPVLDHVMAQEKELCKFLGDLITHNDIQEIVCYGIGPIATCKIAQHQFAVLVVISRLHPLVPCSLYDPVLSDVERDYISRHMHVLPCNDMCSKSVSRPTLFFMVHSTRRMYDNLLQSNWESLPLLTIIGNPFSSYRTHTPDATLLCQAPHVFHCSDYVSESPLPPYTLLNVFNDTVAMRLEECCYPSKPVFGTKQIVDRSQDEFEIIGESGKG